MGRLVQGKSLPDILSHWRGGYFPFRARIACPCEETDNEGQSDRGWHQWHLANREKRYGKLMGEHELRQKAAVPHGMVQGRVTLARAGGATELQA